MPNPNLSQQVLSNAASADAKYDAQSTSPPQSAVDQSLGVTSATGVYVYCWGGAPGTPAVYVSVIFTVAESWDTWKTFVTEKSLEADFKNWLKPKYETEYTKRSIGVLCGGQPYREATTNLRQQTLNNHSGSSRVEEVDYIPSP